METQTRQHNGVFNHLVVCLGAALLLSGCSPQTPSGSGYDPNGEWTPSVQIEYPAPMSEAEKHAIRLESLQSLYESAALANVMPPPDDMPFERWTPVDDDTQWLECINADGWSVPDVDSLPQVIVGSPEERSLDITLYGCNARYTYDPSFSRKPTEQQFGLIYDYRVEWLLPCLAANGWQIDEEPPSRETFIADSVGNREAWDPFRVLAQASYSFDYYDLVEQCPELPPTAVLWGAS